MIEKIKRFFGRKHSIKEIDMLPMPIFFIGLVTLVVARINLFYAHMFGYLVIIYGFLILPILFLLKTESKDAKIEKIGLIVITIVIVTFMIYLISDNFEYFTSYSRPFIKRK